MNIIKRLLAKHRQNASRVSDADPVQPGMISKAAYDRMTEELNIGLNTGKLEPYLEAALNGKESPASSEPGLLDSSLDTLLNRVSKNAKSSPSGKVKPETESLTPPSSAKSTAKKKPKKTNRKAASKTEPNKPRVKGVTWRKDREEYEIRVTKNGKRKTIGYRKTQEEAVQLKEYWIASQNTGAESKGVKK